MDMSLVIKFSGTTFELLEFALFIAMHLLFITVASGKEFIDFLVSHCLQALSLFLTMSLVFNSGRPMGILLSCDAAAQGSI